MTGVAISVRQRLAELGYGAGHQLPALPGGLHVAPVSLRELVDSMRSPRPGRWARTSEEALIDRDWTEECQGVTHDGTSWYVSSNRRERQGIYRLDTGLSTRGVFYTDFLGSDHLGDIDQYQGAIYAALEGPAQVLILAADFSAWTTAKLQGAAGGPPPQGDKLSWCAVCPWNGYLYSSRFTLPVEIYGYDIHDDFRHKTTLALAEPPAMVQGGVISKRGHLLIADNLRHQIRCYSMLDGSYLGAAGVEVNDAWNVKEEVEGLTIWEGLVLAGGPAQVHLIMLDNDPPPNADDVYFKHYTVADPDTL